MSEVQKNLQLESWQGLKPTLFCCFIGPAEAVPLLQSVSENEFFRILCKSSV
jgi:hypothetical protein